MKKKLIAVIVLIAIVAIALLMIMNGTTVQEQQKSCEDRCAPRTGVWVPDPKYPGGQGRHVPTVCECR